MLRADDHIMRWAITLLVAAFTMSACASTQRTLSYPAGMPDADVMVGAARYQVWFHERDRTVLVQRGDPRPLGQLLAQNLTVYSQDTSPGIRTWGAAANAVLSEIGCSPTEVTGADQMREIAYQCVPGTNVQQAVAQNRARWQQGVRVAAPAAS